jgi:hypothetical protein
VPPTIDLADKKLLPLSGEDGHWFQVFFCFSRFQLMPDLIKVAQSACGDTTLDCFDDHRAFLTEDAILLAFGDCLFHQLLDKAFSKAPQLGNISRVREGFPILIKIGGGADGNAVPRKGGRRLVVLLGVVRLQRAESPVCLINEQPF